MIKRLLVATAISSAIFSPFVKAAPFFGEIIYGDKNASGFIYEYEGKNYIPIPIYNSLGFMRQAPAVDIPQCGTCVALEDFAEVQRSGITLQLFPFSDFQQEGNSVLYSSRVSRLTGRSEQTWAFWSNYTGTLGEGRGLLLDNNLSTPWGTLNARTSSNEADSFELNNVQFIHENIDEEYEIITGDINTSRLSWGGNYALSGIGYFDTDPRLHDTFGLARDLAIDIEQYTEVEILANGRTIYKGFQGAGQFTLDNIFSGGLVDIEIRKDSESAEYYQFYFNSNALPEGETNINFAAGQFNRGAFRYDIGIASFIEHGITNDLWVSSSLLATPNNYIGGFSGGLATRFGSLQAGYSKSNSGDQMELGYEFLKGRFRFRASHIEDNNLDAFSNRTLSSVTLGYGFNNASFNASYIDRNGEGRVSLSMFGRIGDLSINGNMQRSDSETSFNIFFNYRIGASTYTNYSISSNDARASLRGNHRVGSSSYSYSLSQSREQGALSQIAMVNDNLSVNIRSDFNRSQHRAVILGSVVYDGNSISLSSERIQSVGIIEAVGGEVLVNGGGRDITIEEHSSSAVRLSPYSDTEINLSPKVASMAINKTSQTFSSGRVGAYKTTVGFTSPGVNVSFEEGRRGDVLNIDGQSYKFFDKIGFFVKDLIPGKYDATIIRDGLSLCAGSVDVKTTYSKQSLQCRDILKRPLKKES